MCLAFDVKFQGRLTSNISVKCDTHNLDSAQNPTAYPFRQNSLDITDEEPRIYPFHKGQSCHIPMHYIPVLFYTRDLKDILLLDLLFMV